MKFYDLMRRRAPQYFYAFDLLSRDGQDLRSLSLIKRKRLLKKIVMKPPVLFVDHRVISASLPRGVIQACERIIPP